MTAPIEGRVSAVRLEGTPVVKNLSTDPLRMADVLTVISTEAGQCVAPGGNIKLNSVWAPPAADYLLHLARTSTGWAEIGRIDGDVDALAPTGALRETIPRSRGGIGSSVVAGPASGVLNMFAVKLFKGDPISTITFASGTTAAVEPKNQVVGMFDSKRVLKRLSADLTTKPWAASNDQIFTLAEMFEALYTGLHYVGISLVAATVPTLTGSAQAVGANSPPPITAGTTADTGLTDPASWPATAKPLAARNGWAWVRFG